ncbi:hypothetical protein RRG08_005933 [Elysia crispata]|uniref:Uncharacterized protein n=1 Tax=Elysia crispata TaxID=231223 RepID=A0AAE1ADK7_9GAST|nr:hypothetical protein RRG08_005933 [Elysia crispata]
MRKELTFWVTVPDVGAAVSRVLDVRVDYSNEQPAVSVSPVSCNIMVDVSVDIGDPVRKHARSSHRILILNVRNTENPVSSKAGELRSSRLVRSRRIFWSTAFRRPPAEGSDKSLSARAVLLHLDLQPPRFVTGWGSRRLQQFRGFNDLASRAVLVF